MNTAGKYFNENEGNGQATSSMSTKMQSTMMNGSMSIKGDAGKLFNAHGRIQQMTSEARKLNKLK